MTKKINDLTIKRFEKLGEQKEIVERVILENRSKTPEETKRYYQLGSDLQIIDSVLEREKQEEEKNLESGAGTFVYANRANNFRDWLNRSITGDTKDSYKVNYRDSDGFGALQTTTDTGIINKTVGKLDVILSPAEQRLRDLGVTFYTGLNGNFTLPSMSEDTASFVAELAAAGDASMLTASVTLTAQRATHTQRITRETLAQSNPQVLNGVITSLINGIWNAVEYKFYDDFETDCGATQVKTVGVTGTTVTFNDLTLMEASLGALSLVRPAYVMMPQTKAYLKGTAALSNQEAIFKGGVVNEYPAIASPAVNNEKIYFGDWTKSVVGIFGNGIEVVIDPFTKASAGEIVLTAVGLFDVGVHNKRAFTILSDASTF